MRRQADELVQLIPELALSFAHYIQLPAHLSDRTAGRFALKSGFCDYTRSALTAGSSHIRASVIPHPRGL